MFWYSLFEITLVGVILIMFGYGTILYVFNHIFFYKDVLLYSIGIYNKETPLDQEYSGITEYDLETNRKFEQELGPMFRDLNKGDRLGKQVSIRESSYVDKV